MYLEKSPIKISESYQIPEYKSQRTLLYECGSGSGPQQTTDCVLVARIPASILLATKKMYSLGAVNTAMGKYPGRNTFGPRRRKNIIRSSITYYNLKSPDEGV
jgi:hypothetical protein